MVTEEKGTKCNDEGQVNEERRCSGWWGHEVVGRLDSHVAQRLLFEGFVPTTSSVQHGSIHF